MSEKKQPSAELPDIKTPEDLLELAADERLKLAQLKTLIEIHPGIVKASIEAVQALAKTSEAAGASQREAIGVIKASINGTIEVLKILAQSAESDSTREKIALALMELAKQHRDLTHAAERMNNSNNGIWKKIALGIGATAALVVGGIATAALKKQ